MVLAFVEMSFHAKHERPLGRAKFRRLSIASVSQKEKDNSHKGFPGSWIRKPLPELFTNSHHKSNSLAFILQGL